MTPVTLFAADAAGLAQLAGAAAAALALLYLLRPRRRRVEVPFGGLWQQVLLQSQARAFGRKWQRFWSFLLLLAIAALLVGALGEPIFRPQPPAAVAPRWSTVLVIDRSASMATLDGRTPAASAAHWVSRLDEAKLAALQWIDALPADEQVLVLAASGHAEVVAGWGADRLQVRQAIAGIAQTSAGLDLHRALADADAMLAGRPGPRKILVTDGGPSLDLAADPTPAFEQLAVGPLAQLPALATAAVIDDLAVASVRLQPALGDPDVGKLTVQLVNRTGQIQPAKLAVRSSPTGQLPADFGRDATLRHVAALQLPAGETNYEIAGVDLVEARFAVQIEGSDRQWRDRAPWNDWGFAVVTDLKRLRVALAGTGNRFLAGALAATGRAEISEVTAADLAGDPAKLAARFDVVVIDQIAIEVSPTLPALVIGANLPADATDTAKMILAPDVAVRAGEHPAMRGVSFQDTNFDEARALKPQPGDAVLAVAQSGGLAWPVMVARESPARRITWGFDLQQTDLVARYAMPILLANALGWLGGDPEPLPPPLELGRPWAVEMPNRRTDWQYREPGQPARPARQAAGQLLAMSEIHGIHAWQDGRSAVVARPTLLPPSEQPLASGLAGKPPVRHPPAPHQNDPAALPRWAWWLLAAAAAIAAEWLLYLRRRTV